MSSSSSAGAPPAPEKSHPILQSSEKPPLAGPRANSSTLDAAGDRSVVATPSWDNKPPLENTDATPPFIPLLGDSDNAADKPGVPASAVSGAESGQELLHRLSLVDGTRPAAQEELPQQEHPGLYLTGRVISATFCIPYKLGFHPNSDEPWVRYCLVSYLF